MFLTACTKNLNQDINARIYDTYTNINSYIAEIELVTRSNLSDKTYIIMQHYKAPDSFRSEILAPDEIKGSKYIVTNGTVLLFPPSGNQSFLLSEYSPKDKNYVFLPDFLSSYYKSEDSSACVNVDLSGSQTVLTLSLNSNNPHRFEQKLWIDNKTLLPAKMETYDLNKKPVLTVIYKDFKINEKIENSMFV